MFTVCRYLLDLQLVEDREGGALRSLNRNLSNSLGLQLFRHQVGQSVIYSMDYVFYKVLQSHRGPTHFDSAELLIYVLNRAIASHEVSIVVEVVEIGLVIIIKLGFFPLRNILTVDREREFLSLIEQLSSRLSKYVVNSPVAEKQVVSVQQGPLLFQMLVFLLQFLISYNLSNGRYVQILNFVLVCPLWIHNKNSASGVETLGIDGNRKRNLDWPNGMLLGKLVEHNLQIDEPIILKQILRLVFFVESKQILDGRFDEEFVQDYVLNGILSVLVIPFRFNFQIFLKLHHGLYVILPFTLYELYYRLLLNELFHAYLPALGLFFVFFPHVETLIINISQYSLPNYLNKHNPFDQISYSYISEKYTLIKQHGLLTLIVVRAQQLFDSNISMFDDLQAVLQDTDYSPSFGASRQQARKPPPRPSTASQAFSVVPASSMTENKITPSVVQQDFSLKKPPNLFGLNKTSSGNFEGRPSERVAPPQPPRTANPISKKSEWDLGLPQLEQRRAKPPSPAPPPFDPDPPALFQSNRRAMNPPIRGRRDSQSNVSLNVNTFSPIPAVEGDLAKTKEKFSQLGEQQLMKIKQVYDEQNRSMKEFYENQLKHQKNSFEVKLKQMQQQLNKQQQIRELAHKEQQRAKLQLKDLQISKLKEMHKLQLDMKSQQLRQAQAFSDQIHKISKKTEVVQQWESRLKETTSGLSSVLSQKQEERLSSQRRELENRQQRLNKRQREQDQREEIWKADTRKQKQLLQNQYLRLQSMQQNLNQRQKKLQREYQLKIQESTIKMEENKRLCDRKTQELQLLKNNLDHQKELVKQSQSYYQKKLNELNDQRQQLLRSCDQQKRNTLKKSAQAQAKLKSIVVRQSQIEYLREELKNKASLLDLQRKRAAMQAQAKIRQPQVRDILINTYMNRDVGDRLMNLGQKGKSLEKEGVGFAPEQISLKKTLTELKNSYLQGLSQMKTPQGLNSSVQTKPFGYGPLRR